jgi:hypothetical protein
MNILEHFSSYLIVIQRYIILFPNKYQTRRLLENRYSV